MNEAALRYSPEIAEAFQKTFTERPATKKSLAVCEIRVAQIPRPMVTTTITATKPIGIQAMSATAHLRSLRGPAPRERRRFGFYLVGRPHEVGGEQPGDRVEEDPQEKPGGAEAADP